MECPNCEKFQDKDNNFCVYCGYDFKSDDESIFQKINKIKCPNCNEYIPKDSEVCPSCNYNLDKRNSPKVSTQESSKDSKSTENKNQPKPIKHSHISKNHQFKRKSIFLTNHDFNLKICPNCESKLLFNDAFCYNCGEDVVNADKKIIIPHKLSKLLRFKRESIFLTNYDFNLKFCPKCNSKLLITDSYCYNCGNEVNLSSSNKQINSDKKQTVKHKNHSTVKTNYPPEFKIAYVLYLESLRKNPKKEFSNKIAKKYDTTSDELEKQALKDNFIELESPLMVAKNLKLTEIKEVLKNHNLKVSGKKEELIQRLSENLSEEELKKEFKPINYLITIYGLNFIKNNNFLLYLHKNFEVSQVITPKDYIDIFYEEEYSQEEIYETIINYCNNQIISQLNEGKLDNFKNYSNALASVLKDQGNLNDSLIMLFKVFLFDINNFSPKPNPSKTKLKINDFYKIFELLSKIDLPPEEIMKLFAISCGEFMLERVISDEDSWKYFAKIANGEDLNSVSKEINEDYPQSY